MGLIIHRFFFLLDVLLLAIRHAKPPPPSGRKGVAISVFFHHLVRHGGEGDPSNGRRRLNEGVPNESQATELVRPPAPPRKKRDGWMFWEGLAAPRRTRTVNNVPLLALTVVQGEINPSFLPPPACK